MPHKTPWWWGRHYYIVGLFLSFLFAPITLIYWFGVRLRWVITNPYRSNLPVVCIGNFTVGGAGKTPMALFLADYLQQNGETPVFLTRGYGGRIEGPHLVSEQDSALDVGDEPLLLAQKASCVVSHDRPTRSTFHRKSQRYESKRHCYG